MVRKNAKEDEDEDARERKKKQAKKNSNINFNITFLSHRSATATAILRSCVRFFIVIYKVFSFYFKHREKLCMNVKNIPSADMYTHCIYAYKYLSLCVRCYLRSSILKLICIIINVLCIYV